MNGEMSQVKLKRTEERKTSKKNMQVASPKLLVTTAARGDSEAIEKKMKLLQSKIFGIFTPTHYTIISKRKVYVPYEMFSFSYHIDRGKSGINKSGYFNRDGEIGVIYDVNEQHAFHFDLFENLDLKEKNPATLDGTILPDQCTSKEVEERCREMVRWKVLHKVYRTLGDIRLIERKKFYREAWELTVECRGKEFIKYAYKDIYASENEHVSGLKVRLDV